MSSAISPRHLRLSLRRFEPRATTLMMACARELAACEMSLERLAASHPDTLQALRLDALARSTHHSTLIESNPLGIDSARAAAMNELNPHSKAEQELLNCARATSRLRELQDEGRGELTPELVRTLHSVMTQGLGELRASFAPEHEGSWRPGVVMLSDPIRCAHPIGVDPEHVEVSVGELCDWVRAVRDDEVEWPGWIVAALVHYNVTHIHPFADGNGRMARLLAAGVLRDYELAPADVFDFDGFYALDRKAYYAALRSVEERTFNLGEWVKYFLAGVRDEYARVRVAV